MTIVLESVSLDRGKAWIARITGICETYGLKREFVGCDKYEDPEANSEVYVATIEDEGIYELANNNFGGRSRQYILILRRAGELRQQRIGVCHVKQLLFELGRDGRTFDDLSPIVRTDGSMCVYSAVTREILWRKNPQQEIQF